MKVCVTAQGKDLNAQVDPRFGRCQYFIFVDTDNPENFEAVENPYKDAPGGAGVQSAQFVANKGVKKVYTGNVGPGARQVLESAGIEVVTVSGTVKEVIGA